MEKNRENREKNSFPFTLCIKAIPAFHDAYDGFMPIYKTSKVNSPTISFNRKKRHNRHSVIRSKQETRLSSSSTKDKVS